MSIKLFKQVLIAFLGCLLVRVPAQAVAYNPTGQSGEQAPAPAAQQSPEELRQLVAPIALYPDALVAQILAASTYPTEIVEADRWMQSNFGLQGKKLAEKVNKQPWDPSVKALTQFPSVLANMDKNLSWTFVAWRPICEPAAGRDGRSSGYAPSRAGRRKLVDQPAGDRGNTGSNHSD
jgi:hypothetical protein